MSRQSGPWWRLKTPATVLVVLLCIGWTTPLLLGWKTFEKAGAIRPESLWDGEWSRLVTSIFLHGSWIHLGINALSLFFVGRVLERGVGRGAYIFFLLASAEAGLAASLVWDDSDMYRVGISGGIAGLIGLVLALEWSITHSVKSFLKQRNTIVVMVLLAINAAFAIWFGRIGGAKIDNAGHIGGLVLGLVAGLAFYTRQRMRPARGVAIALLMLAPALAYASHPVYSLNYWNYRYRTAEDDNERIEALRRIFELDPKSATAAARLADLADDPAPLEKLGAPKRAGEARLVVHMWLQLAERRLHDNPDEAADFASKAAALSHAAYTGWLTFGRLADEAGQTELAELSFREAYAAMKVRRMEGDLWRPAWARLVLKTREKPDLTDPVIVQEWLGLAGEAAGGIGVVDEEQRPLLAKILDGVREVAENAVRTAEGESQRSMARALSGYYGRLASSLPEDAPNVAALDLRMAELWWLGAEDAADSETLELAAGRFGTAWHSARRAGNPVVEARAKAWFDRQRIPLPEPELAEEEDGG
jgi:membrane associated rhomboid family serine protease